MMKKAIVYCLLSVSLFACKKGLMTHEAAREAAEEFYSMLIEGNYTGFVEGYADAENMPEDFRRQLADATAQFMAKDDMRSLCRVEATSDSLSEDSTAYVMLQLHFNDSTSEQVGLSLILTETGWKMK